VKVDVLHGKVPPQAIDIEEAVLGAILMEQSALDTVLDIFHDPEVFYKPSNVTIFKAILKMSVENKAIDMLTVVEELNRTQDLDIVGGAYYISQLTANIASTAHLEDHCRILWQKSVQRRLIEAGGRIIHNSFDPGMDVFDLIDDSEQMVFAISTGMVKQNYHAIQDVGVETIARVEFLRNHPDEFTGVPTGFPSLDRITYGWQPSDLIILAARPSVGKTALALNLARNASKNNIRNVPVGFFCLEMSRGQLTERVLSSESEIFLDKIRRGKMNDQEFLKLQQSADQLPNIYFDDTASLNIFEFRSKARKMVSKNGVGLIIIDYLQLMGSSSDFGNREQEISMITRNLKSIARELDIPIIALSQMSRDIEKGSGRSAKLSDLRESGAIEQDADFVAFLSRDDYQQNDLEKDPAIAGNANFDIRKHRNGSLEKLVFKTDLRIQKWFEEDAYRDYMSRHGLGDGSWTKLPAPDGPSLFIQQPDNFDKEFDAPPF